MKNKIFALSVVPFLTLAACSSKKIESVPSDLNPQDLSFDLFLSRSSLMNPVEFEQYTYRGNNLFQECGKLRRDKFFTEQQELSTLVGNELNGILRSAGELASTLDREGSTFEKPASKERFFDPGRTHIKFTLSEKSYAIDTSLDSISNPSSPKEKKVLSLIKEVRKISKTLCGNNTFFGIAKS